MNGERAIVIGAGVVGLGHALAAARRGWRVTVLERGPRPLGASVRNFGMLWPVGLTPGPWLETALAGRAMWLDVLRGAGAWAQALGSMFVATTPTELAVMEEFASGSPGPGLDVSMLTREEACEASALLRPEAVLGAMRSGTEVGIQPAEALAALTTLLRDRHGVEFRFRTAAVGVEGTRVRTADGQWHHAERVVVAGGADFETLYPRELAALGLKRCKLQMLSVAAPKVPVGPLLASGLTLRHYASFERCASIEQLRREIRERDARLDEFGIHVMAAQHAERLVLGDSHDYADPDSPFDSGVIDELILGELRRFMRVPDWSITERWHGVYSKKPGEQYVLAEPGPGVWLAQAVGGLGMTLALGAADRAWAGGLEARAVGA